MAEPLETHVSCDLCGADDPQQVLSKSGGFYVRCQQCGFVYASPCAADPLAENAEAYQRGMLSCVKGMYLPRRQRGYRHLLRRFSRFRKTNRLLEIGSNVGGFLYAARQAEWEAVGVEPAEVCARYARETHGLQVIATTLEESGLAADTFDVIFSNAVFEHIESPSRTLKAAARVLRPGGVIYICTVNYESYTQELLGAEWQLLAPKEHLSLYTPQTLPRFCTQAGLEILAVRSSGVRNPGRRALPGVNALRKAALSALSRFTLKGDRIIVLARKPAAP